MAGRVTDFRTGEPVAGVTVTFGQVSFATVPPTPTMTTTATTDGSGSYSLVVAGRGHYDSWVNDAVSGSNEVTGSGYRGDLLVPAAGCVSRYGTIHDARSMKPVFGAAVSLLSQTTTTGVDGWYRLDFGCPSLGFVGFNTTFIYVRHPNYTDLQRPAGRGVSGVNRVDLGMERR